MLFYTRKLFVSTQIFETAIQNNTQSISCFRFNHFGYDKLTRSRELPLMYSFVCNCDACLYDYPMWHENTMPAGNVTQEVFYYSDVHLSDMNIEVNKTKKFCSILEEHSNQYPCLALFNIGLKLHRALTLTFGNLSTELQVLLSESIAEN